jgi:hypothetical protein
MKLTAIKAAVAISLLVPVMAMAAAPSSYSFTTSDSSDLKISTNTSGSWSFSASWDDMLAGYSEKSQSPVQANSLSWTLKKGSNILRSGTFTDMVSGPDSGTIVFAQDGLAQGEYKLTLSGLWTATGITNKWHVFEKGDVKLAEKGTFAVTSPVPEPETYAMLLAGLGLMGTIALRRKKSDAS